MKSLKPILGLLAAAIIMLGYFYFLFLLPVYPWGTILSIVFFALASLIIWGTLKYGWFK